MDYIVRYLFTISIEELIIFIGCVLGLLFIIYWKSNKEKNHMKKDLYDHKSITISTLNYTTNERRDTTVVLEKEKKDDTYYLELTKSQGYYISFHVCGDNIIIGTNVDKNCKPNISNNIFVVSLSDSVKIQIKDPD